MPLRRWVSLGFALLALFASEKFFEVILHEHVFASLGKTSGGLAHVDNFITTVAAALIAATIWHGLERLTYEDCETDAAKMHFLYVAWMDRDLVRAQKLMEVRDCSQVLVDHSWSSWKIAAKKGDLSHREWEEMCKAYMCLAKAQSHARS